MNIINLIHYLSLSLLFLACSNSSILVKNEEKQTSDLNITALVLYHKNRQEFSQALVYQNKLVSHYENVRGKNHISTADMYNNKALLYQALGDYTEALNYNQKSLDIKLKYYPNNHDAISTNYDNMGIVYYNMGQYAQAIKYFKKSLHIREEHCLENDTSLADSYNNLAIAFEHISNHKDALLHLEKALKIRKSTVGEKHEYTASIYSAMGSVYERLGKYTTAMKYHAKAIAIHEEILKNKPKTEVLASAYGGMGTLYHKQHKYKEAIGYYMKMLKIRENLVHTKRLSLSEVYNNIGMSYMYLDFFDTSKRYLEKAIKVKEEALGIDTNALQEEYKNLGWLYFNNKKYKQAYVYAKKSTEMLLAQRDDYFSVLEPLEYEHFIKNNQDQMSLLFQCTHYLGDKKSYEDTMSYWLQYKGSMFDNQNRITALYAQKHNKKIKDKIEQLLKYKRELSKLYQHKIHEQNSKNITLEIKSYKSKIKYLKEELSSQIEPLTINLKELLSSLNHQQLYIDFAKIGKHYFGFAIDAQGEIFFRRVSISNSKKIDKLVLSFRKNIKKSLAGKGENNKKIATKLYDMLLKTLLEVLIKDKKELIVSTDGLLRLLPFEALFSTKHQQYLIEYKQLQYIPSGKEFLRLKKDINPTQSSNEVVIFANPDFDEEISSKTRGSNGRMFQMHFSNLEETKKEANTIKEIMEENRVVSYQGLRANEENLFKVTQPKILHIATHGFFIKSELSNPMLNAGIALSGANSALENGRGEGVVTALKLSGMNLKGTELVVLSACETGLVGVNAPDNVSVLSKAFIQAGAKSIVASLWSVSDEGTKELMELFYREIKKGLPYAEALKKAKIEMIKRKVSPAIWGAFILNGG